MEPGSEMRGSSTGRIRGLTTVLVTILLAGAFGAPAGPVAAQGVGEIPSRFSGGLALVNTQPLGSLETGPGWGLGLSAAWALDEERHFRLRGELVASIYGRDTRTVCLSETVGCLIEVDVNTDYSSFYFGVGPEVAVPLPGLELVLSATAGVGSFLVTSSVAGVSDADDRDLFTTEHFSDTFFAWSAGGELRVPVADMASVAVGVRYQRNGEASYVREGGVTLNPDNSVAVDAVTTDANQVVLSLGVAFHPFEGGTEELDDEG